MTNFFGEYECKLDEKGRLKLPSAILNQLGESTSRDFVANRGFERCLYLFPKTVWNTKLAEVQGLNEYLPEVRQFKRYFYRGATEFTPNLFKKPPENFISGGWYSQISETVFSTKVYYIFQ